MKRVENELVELCALKSMNIINETVQEIEKDENEERIYKTEISI